ncbi:alpha/beta hydrolase [Lapillicoccus jejuensis]|uniref:Alpha/beta hydrolase family protein n=1 Tax=Lapillicoccus jejuensis TaxID=402171 RepID=A0A542DXM2_9MICO|nr:alpha/beta hydrolase [Lapillicoccus jejuensis]TQJ07841.1 alpha/beta hydrolase family protein [Lapillicoccus jejuensis]
MTRLRRPAALAGAALVSALVLSSCASLPFLSSGDSAPVSTTPAPGSQTPPAGQSGLARFYTQTLAWSDCQGGQCATLTVPVDYAQPDGATIGLALLKVPARSASNRIGSLVVNPGGPGGSGVDYAKAAGQIVGSGVRTRYDVVGFDPRGVARSAPIDCLPDEGMDRFFDTDQTPEDTAEAQAWVAEAKTYADGCEQRSARLLPHVSTVDAAKDMDVLRAALGEARLTYLGKSYGTFLGATYADLFPTKVGRMVLDGVVPPDLTSYEINLGQAQGFETAARAYVADCVTRSDCPVGRTVDQGMQWLRDFLARTDTQPVPVTDDARVTELGQTWAANGIAQAMYDQSLWPTLSQALTQAAQGSGNLLMRLADEMVERTPGGQYTGNIMEAIYAVNCLDRPDTADIPTVEANARKIEAAAPTFGPLLAWGSVPCGVWPVKATGTPHKVTAQGSGPIVVVGTTRDPATPYEWSVRLRQELANASLVTFDGDGHTAYKRSNSCVDDAIDAYYLDGTVPEDGLRC